jgi:Tol biopolymer transport system component
MNRTAREQSKALERHSSNNGRFVAFQTSAAHFGVRDTNNRVDVYVQDQQTGEFFLVSTDSSGNQGNGDSIAPSISADGRYVAFVSISTNFLRDDSNECSDIFVKDLKTGDITCASTSSARQLANGGSSQPTISPDGRYVTFRSSATNLTPDDTDPGRDTFIKDLQSEVITFQRHVREP